jgi:hypothetical protein
MKMDVFRSMSLILNLILLILFTYGFVLFVKLASRAIKALDIYINEKNKKL